MMAKVFVAVASLTVAVSAFGPSRPQKSVLLADFSDCDAYGCGSKGPLWSASAFTGADMKENATANLNIKACTDNNNCPANLSPLGLGPTSINGTYGFFTGSVPYGGRTVGTGPSGARLVAKLHTVTDVSKQKGLDIRFTWRGSPFTPLYFYPGLMQAIIGGNGVLSKWEFTADLGKVVTSGAGLTPVCPPFVSNPACIYSAFVPFANFHDANGNTPSARQLSRLAGVGLQAANSLTSPRNAGPFTMLVQSFSAASKSATPPVQPPAPGHLWFRYTNPGDGSCKGNVCRCGEVDAGAVQPFGGGFKASRIPAALFKPSNKKALEAYADLTVKLYNIPNGGIGEQYYLERGRCADLGFTSPGTFVSAPWATRDLMAGICKSQCNCAFSVGVNAGGCKDAVDEPSKGKWCSLCAPAYNQQIYVALYNKFSESDQQNKTN